MILCQLMYFVDMRDSSRHVYILQDVHMAHHTLCNNFPITIRWGDSDNIRSIMAAILNFKVATAKQFMNRPIFSSTPKMELLYVYLAPLGNYRAHYFLHGGHHEIRDGRHKIIFTNLYFPLTTQLLAYPLETLFFGFSCLNFPKM